MSANRFFISATTAGFLIVVSMFLSFFGPSREGKGVLVVNRAGEALSRTFLSLLQAALESLMFWFRSP